MERREKKIIQVALSAARGGTSIPSSLTYQEKRFYEKIVALLVDNRKTIFKGGEKSTGTTSSIDIDSIPIDPVFFILI